MVFDHAPVRVSAEWKEVAARELPNMRWLMIPRGATSVCQPCDTHFFGPFKRAVRMAWMEQYLVKVMALQDACGTVKKACGGRRAV